MARRVYARRYARAVFEIALEKKELDRWQKDLKEVTALAENAALMELMENPKVGFDKKEKVLAKLLGKVNPLARNLVYLLVSRGRTKVKKEVA